MTTYPLATLAAAVDENGISAPSYSDILQSLIASMQSIFGSDIYLAEDSQDGQMVAIFAQAIHDSNQAAIAVFQSFSPTYAQGKGLSSVVKINGIRRNVSTQSTAVGTVVGTYGSIITNGAAVDSNGNIWDLPASVTIPIAGSIDVVLTARETGTIEAAIGEINTIYNPQLGWHSISNAAAATSGLAVETDPELKSRQRVSTALPSLSVFEGTVGAVANLPGVSRYKGYENDSNSTDSDGIPAHNIAIVVEGGVSADIAAAIATHKTEGTPTYGTTSVTVYDKYGLPNSINFFRPTQAIIGVEITITELDGFTSSYYDEIKQAVVDYLVALKIGDDILLTKLYVPANLPATDAYGTYDITLIRIKKDAGSFAASNITLAFNEVAFSSASDITIL